MSHLQPESHIWQEIFLHVSSIVIIKKLNAVNKTLQNENILHLRLFFFIEDYGFYYSLLFLSFINGSHNDALLWCHKFTLFSHNCHDHARIRVLLSISSLRNVLYIVLLALLSKAVFHLCFYHVQHFDFQMRGKKLYKLWMKNPWMNKPHPPYPTSILTSHCLSTIIVHLPAPKNFGTKFTLFLSQI